MTQETIDKLHKLINYKNIWVMFKSKFDYNKNIATAKKYPNDVCCVNPPVDSDSVIYPESIEDWEDFKQYILNYVNKKINYYTEEIEKL